VLWICLSFIADPDPAFYLNAHPNPGQTTKLNFYVKNIFKKVVGNEKQWGSGRMQMLGNGDRGLFSI
jgi:hypothetical protein